tara:strand:- start:295 stop:1527 length:1233 start_codon:yes stop_codon:yes gene_type:complete
MTAIVTNDIRFNGSDNFISSIKNVNQMLYLFIGKDSIWTEDTPVPDKNYSRFLEDSYDIEYMSRVYYSNLSRIMKYVIWQPSTSYDKYDDKQDMSGANFFVVSSGHVYKCLDNNNVGLTGAWPLCDPARHAYATTTNGVITTSDHYVWKYMYTIPDGTNSTLNWFPLIETSIANWIEMDSVDTLEECPSQWDVRKNVVPGGIHSFRYASNYPTGLLPVDATVTVTVPGSPTVGTGFVGKVDANNRIICDPRHSTVSGANPGQDYSRISNVIITPDGGSPLTEYNTVPNTDYIYPIFSPLGGHGSNPVRELNGFYILVTSNISGIAIQYRKVGLISNPLRKTRSDGSDNKLDYIKSDEVVLGEKIGKEFITADSDYLRGTGEIIYIENKGNTSAETITVDGIKQVKLILSF